MIGFVLLIIGLAVIFTSSKILKSINKYSQDTNLVIRIIGFFIALSGILILITT